MRIGLFGGTFNPVHLGHLHAAKKVQEGFGLDKIYLIPSALPPHKETTGLVDAKDRIDMINMAILSYPPLLNCAAVSDVELRRPGPSYTIDTVFHFKSIFPEKTKFYFILGVDAFLEIDTWKSYMKLFELISFIVMSRPDINYRETSFMWKRLKEYLTFQISSRYRFISHKSCYIHKEKQPVFILDVAPLDISSTMIRKLANQGLSIKPYVTEKVEKFIKDRGLYL